MVTARSYLMVSAITLVVMAGRLGFTDRPILLQAMVEGIVVFGLIVFMLLVAALVLYPPSALLILLAIAIWKAFAASAGAETSRSAPAEQIERGMDAAILHHDGRRAPHQ